MTQRIQSTDALCLQRGAVRSQSGVSLRADQSRTCTSLPPGAPLPTCIANQIWHNSPLPGSKINSQVQPPTSDWLQIIPPLQQQQRIVGLCRRHRGSQKFRTPKARKFDRKFLRLDSSMFIYLPMFRCVAKNYFSVLGLGLEMKNGCFYGWKLFLYYLVMRLHTLPTDLHCISSESCSAADFHWMEFLTSETQGWGLERTALDIHIWATFHLNSSAVAADMGECDCVAAELHFLPPSPSPFATKGGARFGVISTAGFKEPPSSESMQRLV